MAVLPCVDQAGGRLTFDVIQGPPGSGDLFAVASNGNEVFVGGRSNRLFKRAIDGGAWVALDAGLPDYTTIESLGFGWNSLIVLGFENPMYPDGGNFGQQRRVGRLVNVSTGDGRPLPADIQGGPPVPHLQTNRSIITQSGDSKVYREATESTSQLMGVFGMEVTVTGEEGNWIFTDGGLSDLVTPTRVESPPPVTCRTLRGTTAAVSDTDAGLHRAVAVFGGTAFVCASLDRGPWSVTPVSSTSAVRGLTVSSSAVVGYDVDGLFSLGAPDAGLQRHCAPHLIQDLTPDLWAVGMNNTVLHGR